MKFNHDSRVLIDMETSYCVTIKENLLLDVFCFQVALLLLFLWQRFQMRNFRKLPFLLLLTSFSSLVSNFFYFVILFTNNLLLPPVCNWRCILPYIPCNLYALFYKNNSYLIHIFQCASYYSFFIKSTQFYVL